MAKFDQNRHTIAHVFHYAYKRKIGLLGGSFNPAHAGHIALSQAVKKHAQCDEIWWLVSPQNPLKSKKDMADYQTRLHYARTLVKRHRSIKVLGLEAQLNTSYSYDIMRILKRCAPQASFAWIMGTDNLVQLPLWYRAKEMTSLMPFIVVRRDQSFYQALASKGHSYFRQSGNKSLPSLCIMRQFHDPHSATKLRAQGFWHRQAPAAIARSD